MEKYYIFIGILLFLLLVLLWFCFVIGDKANLYEKKYKDLQKKLDKKIKEFNTLTLWYEAYKEALDTEEIKSKH